MAQSDIITELERLMKLYQAGVITSEELENLKKKAIENDKQTNSTTEAEKKVAVPIDIPQPIKDEKTKESVNTDTDPTTILIEKVEEIKKPSHDEKIKAQENSAINNYIPEKTNTKKDNSAFQLPTPIKWYNVRNKLLLSLLFWPAFVYGFFRSELVNTKLKYGIVIAIVLLIAYYATFSFINGNAYKKALKNAELIIKFNEGSTNSQLTEPNVEIHIIFENNKIVSYTSNVDRYNVKYDLYGNLVFDSRFNEVKNYGYDLVLATPLNNVSNKSSEDISKPWSHKMYISIDDITNYKSTNNELFGSVTLTNSSYDYDKKKWKSYSDKYKASFIIINLDNGIIKSEDENNVNLDSLNINESTDEELNQPILRSGKYKCFETSAVGLSDDIGRYTYWEYKVSKNIADSLVLISNADMFNSEQSELLDVINKKIINEIIYEFKRDTSSFECLIFMDKLSNNNSQLDTINTTNFIRNIQSISFEFEDFGIEISGNDLVFHINYGLPTPCLSMNGTSFSFPLDKIEKYLNLE